VSSPADASALYHTCAHGCRVCERTDVEDAPPDTASSRLAPFASVQRVRSALLILDATSEVKHSLCSSKHTACGARVRRRWASRFSR